MYFDTAKELDAMRSRLLQECHEERMRVIKLEGQRLTLLSHLRSAGALLKSTYPIVSARYLEVAQEIADDYAAKPVDHTAGNQASDAGSASTLLPVSQVPSHSTGKACGCDVCQGRITPVYTEFGPTTRAPF
jgi:hypothetical protein